MKPFLKHAILIFAGVLFLFSGVMKVIDSQSFARLLNLYGAGWAAFAAPFISGTEVILGLCLILHIKSKHTAFITGILTILFTLAFAYAYFIKGLTDCGCLGSSPYLKISPWLSFTRNILIITGCFWVWRFTEAGLHEISTAKKWMVYGLGSITFCFAGYTMGHGDLYLTRNRIHVGDHLDIHGLHAFKTMISKGTSLVFVFSPDCVHCINATENIKSICNIPAFSNVIGIALFGDTTSYMQTMKPNFPVYIYPSNDLHAIIHEVPVLLVLRDGKIVRIFKSTEIPCGELLKRMVLY